MTTKYHRTPSGHTYGIRKKLFSLLYVPSLKDTDVIAFLLQARAEGRNITQLITDAIRLIINS
jgi:hypothetical protein